MIAGLYSASTNMDAAIRQQDAIASNIANAGVNGHKAKALAFRSFPELLFTQASPATPEGNHANRTIGRVGTGVGVDWAYLNFESGPLVTTGVPTDLAIEGEGFFSVRTPRGERYTRNGTFKLVPDSQTGLATITTADGYPLLGANGPIQVPVDQDFEVDQAGNVLLDGLPADRVRVVELEDRNVLLQESSSLFQVEDRWRDQVHPAERSVVRQGTLEKSNVNTVLEMVRMIESFRNYESAAKVVSVLDRSLGLAVNQIAGT